MKYRLACCGFNEKTGTVTIPELTGGMCPQVRVSGGAPGVPQVAAAYRHRQTSSIGQTVNFQWKKGKQEIYLCQWTASKSFKHLFHKLADQKVQRLPAVHH